MLQCSSHQAQSSQWWCVERSGISSGTFCVLFDMGHGEAKPRLREDDINVVISAIAPSVRYRAESGEVGPPADLCLLNGGTSLVPGERLRLSAWHRLENQQSDQLQYIPNHIYYRPPEPDCCLVAMGQRASETPARTVPEFRDTVDQADYDELVSFIMRFVANVPCPKASAFFHLTPDFLRVCPPGIDGTDEGKERFRQLDAARGVRADLVALVNDRFRHMNIVCYTPSLSTLHEGDDGISVYIKPRNWTHTYFITRLLATCGERVTQVRVLLPRLVAADRDPPSFRGNMNVCGISVPVVVEAF